MQAFQSRLASTCLTQIVLRWRWSQREHGRRALHTLTAYVRLRSPLPQMRNRPRQLHRCHLVLPAEGGGLMGDESARLALAISVPGVGIILAVISPSGRTSITLTRITTMRIFSLDLFVHVPESRFPIAAPALLAAKLCACESDHENFSPVTQLSLAQTRAGSTRRTMRSCHFRASRPSVLNRGPDRASSLASAASLRLCR